METSTKVLLVACFVLVAILGFMIGVLVKLEESQLKPLVSINGGDGSSSPQVSTVEGAEWHEIATFTGSGDDYQCFTIEGSKFKVVMSAVPMITYQPNTIQLDIIKDGEVIATRSLEWGATEYPDRKREIIEIPYGPGTYCIRVYTVDIENWQVTIWDYY
ncbi:MAG TPA: hypothetical protein HA298_04905 [Methanobacteriales archaeon]|nr:MAG: hypothetical protein XD44_1048 [Methanobacteriaceae archaeon 41_258]MBC7096393.1 hypothetical protein [Methanobacteriales archaeon]HIH62007.1 hypothetical protein [Methanobacteriales archaeon]